MMGSGSMAEHDRPHSGSCAHCGGHTSRGQDGDWCCRACRSALAKGEPIERWQRPSRSPFQPGDDPRRLPAPVGNGRAVKHGARSEKRWAPIAEQLVAEAGQVAPWLSRPAFATAVAAWARTEARLVLVTDWLAEHGELDDAGAPRPATNLAAQLDRQAERLRAKLGLDPASLATILARLASLTSHERTAAGGSGAEELIAALAAEGRAALAAHHPLEKGGDG